MIKLIKDLVNKLFKKKPQRPKLKPKKDTNLSILVGSCDKYEPLWNNFLALFDRYWDHDIQANKYFISETVPVPTKSFQTILTGNLPFSECLRMAIDKIESPYILWLQDDYFLRKKLLKDRFDFYIYLMKELNIDRFGIHSGCSDYFGQNVAPNLFKLYQYSYYTVSMQASIWNRELLKFLLPPPYNSESPWQFETNGTERLNDQKMHNVLYEQQFTPWYIDVTRRGKVCPEYFQIIQQENLRDDCLNSVLQ